MTGPNKLSPEVSKILSFLELLIVARNMGIREFERRAKMSAGSLSRLFSGKHTLRVQTVLDMLEALEVSPLRFFTAVFSMDEPNSAGADELVRGVQSLTFPEPAPPVYTRSEVQSIIEEVFSKLQKAPPTRPSEEAPPVQRPRRRPARRPRPDRPNK